jgi:hypothetical protein
MLSELTIVRQTSGDNGEGEDRPNEYYFSRILVGGEALHIRLRDDRVAYISIINSEAETISNIVGRIGEPESVYATYVGPENVKLRVELFYPSKGAGYIAESKLSASEAGPVATIDPDMIVDEAVFTSPGTIQSMLEDLGQSSISIQCVLQYVQPWTGYGSIQVNVTCP